MARHSVLLPVGGWRVRGGAPSGRQLYVARFRRDCRLAGNNWLVRLQRTYSRDQHTHIHLAPFLIFKFSYVGQIFASLVPLV